MRDSVYKILVVALLTINTFFLGSIWSALVCQSDCLGKKSFCPLKSAKSGAICPITGKPLQSAQ